MKMLTPSDSLGVLLTPGTPQEDVGVEYPVNEDALAKNWSEWRLAEIQDARGFSLHHNKTGRIICISRNQAHSIIKRLGLVYKHNEKAKIGGEWVSDTIGVSAERSGSLVQGFIAKARRILSHTS